MMQGFCGSKLAGTWAISVTFWRPLPSSRMASVSVPATLPSPLVTTPLAVTLGP